MTRIIYAETFFDDMLVIAQPSKRDEVFAKIDLLANMPTIGSNNVPQSIRTRYGHAIRKLVVCPFDVIYEYDAATDSVHVLGIVHQRAAF